MELKERFVAEARKFVGTHFNPSISAQCAEFIRAVAEKCGIEWPVSTQPYDNVRPFARGYANSLCGPEIGKRVTISQPGDLVFFINTYGDYEPGTITHVGIVSKKDFMIDRSTMDAPVRERSIYTFGPNKLWGFVHPKIFDGIVNHKVKLFANENGGFKLVVPQTLQRGTYEVEFFSAEVDLK